MRVPRKAKIRIKPEYLTAIKEDERLIQNMAEILVMTHRYVKQVLVYRNDPLLVLSKPTLRLIAKTLGVTTDELTEERPQEPKVENAPAA